MVPSSSSKICKLLLSFILSQFILYCSSAQKNNPQEDIAFESLFDVANNDIVFLDSEAIDNDDRFIDSDNDGIPDKREVLLGTDPYDPDTDKDGIKDGDEFKQRTDPLNPASAKAWHPEINYFPRLFFDKTEQEQIKDHIKTRIEDKLEPYLTIYKRIQSRADRELIYYGDTFDVKVSPSLGEIAESAAFIGWLYNDIEYLNKAKDAIEIPFPDPTNVPASAKYNLYESEAMVSFCQAYEYIASSNMLPSDNLKAAKENLTRRLNYFREITHNGTYAVGLAYLNNNHKIKVLAALGLCAMLLNDRDMAAYEISSALTGIDFLMGDFQNANGVYAEGWSYLNYTDNSLLPFIFAYHRFAKGAELPYYGVENISGGSPHSGKIVTIRDFLTNPSIEGLYKTALISSQPNGLMNPIDDSNPECLHGAILYRLFDDPDFLWQWYKKACEYYTTRLHTLSLILLTDRPPPDKPANIPKKYINKEGGVAIMRSGFDDSDIYFTFIGEHGKARTNGLGHEHPDELSFILWAYGEPLVIDAGYINWDNHDKTKYSKDHSIIAIDGLGSEYDKKIGTDAYLSDIFTKGFIDYISGATSYNGADINRTTLRIRERYFILFDEIALSDNNVHTISIQINGASGPDIADSSLTITNSEAEYKRGDVILRVSVLSNGENLRLSSRIEEYAISWGVWGNNEMLIADAEATRNIFYLTLLLPYKKDEGIYSSSEQINKDLFIHYFLDQDYEYIVVLNNTSAMQELNYRGLNFIAEKGLNVIIFSNGSEIDRTVLMYK